MKTKPIVGVGLLMLAAMQASAQSSPATLPTAALKAWQTHARSYCGDIQERYVGARFTPLPASGMDGSALQVGAGRFLAVELNGDGKPDYVIATPNGGCAGLNEGRDGPQLTIDFVLSTANGYVWDSRRQSGGYEETLTLRELRPSWIQRRGNASVLRYPTGSAGAGRCGPLPTEVVWGWNGRHVDVLERYNTRRQLVDEEGCAVRPARAAAGAQGKPAAAAIPARIPLAVGYYVYTEGTFSTCAKPVIVRYFDGRRFWEESDLTDPEHNNNSEAVRWEMVTADRFRISSRMRDEDGRWDPDPRFVSVTEYAITGPQSFVFLGTVGHRLRPLEKYQLCPNIPAKERFFRGAK